MKKRDKTTEKSKVIKISRRAELTSKHLVYIILLVLGFLIVLFLYWQISWTGTVDKEVCHQSVILKATAPDVLGTKEFIPLKCKTRRVCITDKFFGKGDCKEFEGEDYDKVRVSGDKEEKEKQINMFIAREMADCWAMMGESKIQVFAREFYVMRGAGKKCVVCTRIAFDESIKENIKEINGLGKYLITHNVPNKDISYWEFLTSGLNDEDYDPRLDKYSIEEKAIVFMEIGKTTAPRWIVGIFGGTAGGLVGAKIGAAIGSIVPGGGTIAGGFIGFIGGSIVGGLSGRQLGILTEKELVAQELKGDFTAANFFLDYDASKITELECESFENIP